jgi:aldehyde:ferredoxin oxidoreductase
LKPENRLIFMAGPLVGLAPGCSRYCVATKSPLTGAFLDAYSGGHFPAHLRFALPDHLGIVVEGRARDLTLLRIDHGKASLESAPNLKGRSAKDVSEAFPEYKVSAIGPAGENLVKFATVSNDGGTHHAGRAGAGAVMGSKRLKAVLVRGAPLQDDRTEALRKTLLDRMAHGEGQASVRANGTPGMVTVSNGAGTLPTRQWTRGSFSGVEGLSVDVFHRNQKSRVACYLCPIACGFNLEFTEGAYEGLITGKGPEYETIGMMGSNLEIGDLSAVAKLGCACDELGMDTITAGSVLGFAMECAEKGILDEPVHFGNPEEALRLLRMIAARDGVGDLLAEGSRRAAEELGGEAGMSAVEVKGLELPAWGPRASHSMALAYATSDRGACHMRSWAVGGDAFGPRDPFAFDAEHASAVIADQNGSSALWSLISCAFTGFTNDDAVAWLDALGYETSREDLDVIGERVWNLTRMFNVREGFRRDDQFPVRLTTQPLQDGGPADGKTVDAEILRALVSAYYEQREWSPEGVPSPQKLASLELQAFQR